jgi:hypothetical protein
MAPQRNAAMRHEAVAPAPMPSDLPESLPQRNMAGASPAMPHHVIVGRQLHEEPKQEDDRNRNADEPESN